MDSTSPCNSNTIDIWGWLQSLPPLSQWKENSISTSISSSLNLSVSKPATATTTTTIAAGKLTLWTSKPLKFSEVDPADFLRKLFLNILHDFLHYPSSHDNDHEQYSFLFDNLNDQDDGQSSAMKETFNLAFISLSFITSVHNQAPFELRLNLKDQLSSPSSCHVACRLMRAIGSTLEEQWMRSLNLAITALESHLDIQVKTISDNNNDNEDNNDNNIIGLINGLRTKCPSTLFSNALSKSGMWKLQVYCPLSAMEIENSSGSADDQLMFSLNHHQLEGVLQLNYKVVVKDKWVELLVSVDNVRLNVVPLLKEEELNSKGEGKWEKHFPSRISLQLTPSPPSTDLLSVSVSKSSDNPTKEINHDRTIQGSLDATSMPGLSVSASDSTTTTLKPWKFEESAQADSGSLSWFLHDATNGREVFASQPSILKQLFQPKAWFKNRYSAANRPFTRQGGVVFAGDEYGDEVVCWKIDKAGLGKDMRWEVKGSVGLTYWPNQCRTLYNDTRKAEFKDFFYLNLN